jgi:hypothetical protein
MLDNKWRDGIAKLEIPFQQPEVLAFSGIKPFPLIVDKNIGPEIILLITDSTERVKEFKGIAKTEFYAKTGLVKTSYGPVFWILFYFPSLVADQTITYECVVNPKSQIHMDVFKQLALQKYWHVIITDETGEVVNFFEFTNIYGLADSLYQVENVCSQLEVSDFFAAKTEYEGTYSAEELLDMVTAQPED